MKRHIIFLTFLLLISSISAKIKVELSKNEFNKIKEKAEKFNDPDAQYSLGYSYLWGRGVKKNVKLAIQWYTIAALNGNLGCQYLLGLWYENGENVKKDLSEALRWYQMAADNNHAGAQCFLGKYYENKKELDKALELYRLSANQGNQYALERLHVLDPTYELKKDILSLEELNKNIVSWAEFYNKNRKVFLTYKTKEEIEKEILNTIEKWQIKNEFESTDEWRNRVNDNTRERKISELKSYLIKQYETEKRNLEEEIVVLTAEYEKYKHEYFDKEYYNKKRQIALLSFSVEDFTLMPYDADNQSFMIKSETLGDILINVSRNDAPSFKSNWETIKKNIEPEYMPNGEDVSLTRIHFRNGDKDYIFDSHTNAQYAMSNINYNFSPVELKDINISDINLSNISQIPQENMNILIGIGNDDKILLPKQVELKEINLAASEKSNIDSYIPQKETAVDSNTFAVLIANENYNHVNRVPFALNDANILSKYLSNTIGMSPDHIKCYSDASYGNIAAALKHIENLSIAYGNKLNLIFFYAGHGIPNEKTKDAMLLPVDGDSTIPETCYDLGKLYSQLGNLNANSILVLMDACFSGSLRGEGMLMAARGIKIKSNIANPKGNMIIMTAAQGDETAFPYEKEQHGMFTYFLLKKLQENKGNVTLGELADYLVEKVKQQSVVINGKLQTPSISISPQMENRWRDIKFGGN